MHIFHSYWGNYEQYDGLKMFIIEMYYRFRYRGKKSPDAILAEICWWYQKTFVEQEKEEEEEADDDKEYRLDEFTDLSDDDQDISSESDDDDPKPSAKRSRAE